MSANSGTLPSTKGESTSTSNKTTKLGYDHLDINKLYKGKSAEPVLKTVTQKHGMQTLGKAPPARRAGALTSVKSDTIETSSNSSPVPQPSTTTQQQLPSVNQQPPPGWIGTMPHPMGPPPQPPHNHNVPGVPLTGQPHLDKKWTGGAQRERGTGNFPSQRFAQDFPSLEATGEPAKGQTQNSSGPSPGTVTGLQSMAKVPDNQYGPGPVLRPQTEGSWIQGGGMGMPRPHGPMQSQNASSRDFATDRSNLGGPTPPPMSLGQVGPIPPPLGAYPMSFRGMPPPPYMYQGSGPPGSGGFYPPAPGIRYGMPIPPGAPPPGSYPPGGHPGDGRRDDSGRGGRGPPNQIRPGSHFTSTPIIKKGEMERMDEIGTQEGGWASTNDTIDYNKKINFSDEEECRDIAKRAQINRSEPKEPDLPEVDWDRDRDRITIKSEKQQSTSEREREHPRFEHNRASRDPYEHENEDERNKRRTYDNKDNRDRDRGGRRPRDDDWRSGNRYEDDRGKKAPMGGTRIDPRGTPQDFQSSKYTANIPPRFQRQNVPPSFNQPPNQRQTPSPVSTTLTSGNGKERDRDYRDRDWERGEQQPYREPAYRILERRKTDSESSRDGRDAKDVKRNHSINDHDTRLDRFQEKDHGKSPRIGSENRSKGADEINKSGSYSSSGGASNTDKEGNDLDTSESPRTVSKNNLQKDDAKTAFRSRTDLSTSSWADEVEDEEYNKVNEDLNLRKPVKDLHQSQQLKRFDERDRREVGPRRVFINQRKVENLVTQTKPEVPTEQKVQPKKEDKTEEKTKISSAWGERATKEKDILEKEEPDKPIDEKEIEKSSSRDSLEKDKPKKEGPISQELDRQSEFDRRKNFDKRTDSHKSKEFDKHNEQDKHDKEFKSKDKEVERRERDRLEREDYEARGQRCRRDRDRKSAPVWNDREKVKQEKEDTLISHSVKERTPEEKDKDNEKEKTREPIEAEKGEKEDSEIESRSEKGQRGTRNRERGQPVYQARGAWGGRRGGRGVGNRGTGGGGSGGSSHYYDKAAKRHDSDRDRDHDEKEISRESSEFQIKENEKETTNKEVNGGSSQDSATKNSSQDEKPMTSNTKKSNTEKEIDGHKKATKSPSGGRRNGNGRGGSRLQGYGPPSDRNPFSSSNSKQEEEPIPKEKPSEGNQGTNKQYALPPVTSGPVPLMALGEISPPEMPPRSRHGGGYGHNHQQHGGRAVPPRMRGGGGGDSYSFRGGSSNKRGGGGSSTDTAKPLMSLNSNDLERGGSEWISESESEAESKKRTSTTAGVATKKESNGSKAPGAGSEKYRQNQNLIRTSSTGKASSQDQANSSSQDSVNNNKGNKSSATRVDSEYSATSTQSDLKSSVSQESPESIENEPNAGFHEVRNKKTTSGSKDNRNQKENFEKTSGTNVKTEKMSKVSRPVKNPPYDPRPQMAPRFLAAQHQRESPPMQPTNGGQGSAKTPPENASVNSFKEPAPVPHGNAWEKPITASLRLETQISGLESKDADLKLQSHTGLSGQNLVHPVVAPIGQSGNCPPVQTMIFENTNYKSGVGANKFQESNNKAVAPGKISEGQGKKEITGASHSQGLEMSKEFPLAFGEDAPQLDFGCSFSDPPTSSTAISSHSQVYKSSGLLQSARSYGSHQSSPISPLAADLTEKIQGVKSVWDLPPMPSVAEQSGNSCGSEDSLPGGFSNDAFKRPEPPQRDFGQSHIQQTSSGFAIGASPVMSVIAKPDSRSSPNLVNVRQIKPPQQQNLMDPQNHATVSSSPFTYGIAQQHQGANTFGMRAVPSPPALLYGSSHASSTPNAVYQAFPQHVDSSQVVGSNPRSQFPQYTNAQVGNTGGAPYLSGSLFLPLFESHYSLQNYHTQHQHQQQAQGIPPVQVQSQNNRISPGPMPMTSASAGVVGGTVMMNSNANSIINMKAGQPGGVSHPNIGHQVHPGNHQQAYSQFDQIGSYPGNKFSHMGHPQHHLGPVGHQKQGYSQSNMPPQTQHQMNQMYIPFDPNQQPVLNLGQNYLSGGLRTGHGGGPPPSATPPMQGLPSSSPYYGSAGNQSGVYPGGSSQGGNLQPLHVAVAPGPQGLQNLRMVCPPKKKWNSKPHYS